MNHQNKQLQLIYFKVRAIADLGGLVMAYAGPKI